MTPEQYAKTGSEFAHQVALFMWAAMVKQQWPELELMFAIKNEEKSGSKIVGGRFKASGVKADVPDIFLPVAKHGCHGLFIEMKRPGKKARPGQAEFGLKMKAGGYGWVCCDNWEAAKNVLIQYLTE
jgi:hypothetical protein